LLFLIKGIVLGFSIAAPVGPIGILCIRRTLSKGMVNGFISGLGAATADSIYGLIAALGISAVSTFLADHQFYLRLSGGIFILYLGYITFKSIPAEAAAGTSSNRLPSAFASTFFLTITNPITIMSFAAVFAGIGVGTTDETYISSLFLVIGVFTGSSLWWLFLSAMINVLRHKFDQKQLKLVNQLSGLLLTGFGIFSLISI